ncbi:MAG: PrsW family intramembrane metalloprotease [Ruminococcaceae bacterium]|nr:PrsW family intramembrane metalloprotease [Oscillospiraceae bacterium]
MAIMILGYLLSIIPALALFFWLRARRKDDAAYRKLCDQAMLWGLLCTLGIIVLSAGLDVALALSGLKKVNPLLYEALHAFIVLALVEEAVKFLASRRVLKKTDYPYSWMDVVMVMVFVGLGFGAAENIAVAVQSGLVVMLIRAVTIGHGGYGFLVGYFYGKGMKTGKNGWKVLGFALAWLFHGMYDFSLSEEFTALGENLEIVAVALAALSLVFAVVLIVFFARAAKREIYTQPLVARDAEGAEEQARTSGDTTAVCDPAPERTEEEPCFQ